MTLLEEYGYLLNWFETEYSQKEQKYRRLRTLGILCDDGDSPYDKLMELYRDAEIKRKRIQELEILLAQQEEIENNKIKGETIDA